MNTNAELKDLIREIKRIERLIQSYCVIEDETVKEWVINKAKKQLEDLTFRLIYSNYIPQHALAK